jgi:hypothetical protein
VNARGASTGGDIRPAGASILRARHREQIMTTDSADGDNLDRLGETVSMIFIACLVAFFFYGYIPHFLFG